MSRSLIVLLCILGAGAAVFFLRGVPPGDGPSENADHAPQATYVGRATCARCHAEEAELWTGSHHDLAMQEASPETVLGDFEDASHTQSGVTSRFSRRQEGYFVRTDGPDGTLRDYQIRYTFGVEPLQQYLVELERGRFQVLPLCWDARPEDQGGQRWFHLYQNETVDHTDPLHWTAPSQNWNYMCAECHSTDLQKGYDPATDTFNTTWEEIDVSCEGCHGPGSLHAAWAERHEENDAPVGDTELEVSLRGLPVEAWILDKTTGSARREGPLPGREQVETCARCHSRRSVIAPYVHGHSLLDTHRLSLLEERLYHADGQILDEVYVYGSWVQSRMHHQGVVCSDCHDPHSLRLRSEGNTLCYRCHLPDRFDVPAHHHHPEESTGALCVNCHMPERTYMVVDPRRDHSIRVPRPDLSQSLGTPNACNGCHEDEEAAWAAEKMDGWYGRDWRRPHFGEALHMARSGSPTAYDGLARIVSDAEQPALARGTALTYLAQDRRPEAIGLLQDGARAEDPIIRLGTAAGLEFLPAAERALVGVPLLEDAILSVRAEAARWLAAIPRGQLSSRALEALDRALDDYRAAQRFNADRAWAHVNLAGLHTDLGELNEAEAEYLRARRLDPRAPASWVNLADLLREMERDDESLRVLEEAARGLPDDPGVRHALGLALVRVGRQGDALTNLELAANLDPSQPRYAYAFALALQATGQSDEAIASLWATHGRHPNDQEVLLALATIQRDRGLFREAIDAARRLAELAPQDRGAANLLRDLQRRAAGRR